MVGGSRALERRPVRPVLTVGNFDGLHLGHRTIMETIRVRARALRGEAVVFTFDPHPRKVLQGERAPKLLTTMEQRIELLEELGIDLIVVQPFTEEFARTSPARFVREFLWEPIRPREVYVGYDFHFGRDREGSMRQLTEMGPRLGFAVTIVPEVTVGDRDVNSTRVRALLAEGEVAEAAELLGRLYTVRGRVVPGDRRGRDLGFPTANLEPENEILPAAGVYAARVRLLDAGRPPAGTRLPAVTNVGVRPTFHSGDRLLAEAHLIDFEGDLYGRRIELAFEERLRGERRFESVDALREQIGRDREEARRRLADPAG